MAWKNVQYQNGKMKTSEGGGSSSENYSTDEQVVGTWIDGTNIYKQTFMLNSDLDINANSWVDTAVSVTNKKYIINCTAFNAGGTFWGQLMASVDSGGSYVQIGNARATNIRIRCFTLWYTKTTDV